MQLSLRTRIVAICVVILVLSMTAIAAANYWVVRDATMRSVEDQAEEIAQAHAQRLAQWLQSKQAVVSSLVPHIGADERISVLRTAVKAAGFDQAYMGYPDGSYLFSENRSTRAADYDPRTRAWYKGALATGGKSISEPYIGASTGKLIITFSELVGRPQQEQGVVAGDVMLDAVVESVAAVRPTAHSFAFMVSGTGAVVAHPDRELLLKPVHTLHPDLSLQRLAANEAHPWQMGGRDVYLFAQPIAGTPWQLAVAMDAEEVTAGLDASLRNSIVVALLVSVAAAALLYVLVSRALARLQGVQQAIAAAGQGDFTRRLQLQGNDELTHIGQAYNQFAESITQVLHRIQGTSSSVEVAASEIAAGNQHLSSRTEHQAEALTQTVQSLQQLTDNVQRNAEHANSANQLAQTAYDVAHKGGDVVQSVVQVMEEIQQSSRRIADIIGVIDGIAFQTNILALNAAVEAARAGEQGRGFAVVAGEVRSLAQRSATAAREIHQLIGESVQKVGNGTTMVQQAGQTMQEIEQSVQRVTGIMSEISAASQAQSHDIAQIHEAVVDMEGGTQQNTALVEQAAAAAGSLREQAAVLAQLVQQFQLEQGHRASTSVALLADAHR